MIWEYSEDNLIEQTAIDLFFNRLGWDTLLAYNKESFGEGSTLGRLNKKEVMLKKLFFEKLKEFNPGLPEQAYSLAYEKITEETITKSLAEINFEKYQLLKDGIPVDFINEKGEQVKNKLLKVIEFENPEVVDKSIENMVAEPTRDNGKLIDLSGLNFGLLEQFFLKTKNKNTVVQSLKDKVEKQLKQMVEKNPLRVDFYHRYQEIIDEYNRGKDSVTIEETFKRLIDFVNSLSEEEAETRREGLTEEQKAIFDIIRKPNLSETEKKKIKKIAIELLDELKKDKLKVDQWAEKSVTATDSTNQSILQALC